MILEVIGIERLDGGSKGPCYNIKLEAKGETIYDNQAFIKLPAAAAASVKIGDKWLVQPLTLARVAEVGSLTPIADVVARTERRVARMGLADMEHAGVSDAEARAGLDAVPEVPLGWMPDTEDGRG